MSDPEEIIEGMLNVLVDEHADDIARMAVAQTLGKATRIWWDNAAETFRFKIVDWTE